MTCRYCRMEVSDDADRCPHCTSWLQVSKPLRREWYRRRQGKMIAGVATGIADQFELPLALVRLIFLLSLCLGGGGLIVYLACWIVMPMDERQAVMRPIHDPSSR
jgi:phage shock protein C